MTISVVGTGKIVDEVLQMLLDEHLNITPVSIYAHSNLARAHELARKYAIGKVYTNFSDLLTNDTADVIYIANINIAHYSFVRQSLLANRHVIVEKPMCMNYKQTKELITLAERRSLLLIEAVSLLYMPNLEGIRNAITQIGRVKMVRCDYFQYSSRYESYLKGIVLPVFDPEKGGGALRDLNIYNLNFIVALFGLPVTMEYHPRKGYNNVDLAGVFVADYNGFQCVCSAAKDFNGLSHASIQGEIGNIFINGPVNELSNYSVTLFDEHNQPHTEYFNLNAHAHRLAHEFEQFEYIFNRGDTSRVKVSHDISISVARIIDRVITCR